MAIYGFAIGRKKGSGYGRIRKAFEKIAPDGENYTIGVGGKIKHPSADCFQVGEGIVGAGYISVGRFGRCARRYH